MNVSGLGDHTTITQGSSGVSALPPDCELIRLTTHADSRGDLTEVLRNAWIDRPLPRQRQVIHSAANALCGMSVSVGWIYACILRGTVDVGLHDLRPAKPGVRSSCLLTIDDSDRRAVLIAPGVAHGFYFPRSALLFRSIEDGAPTRLLGRWSCGEFGIPWRCSEPLRDSAEDDELPYAEFRARYAAIAVGQ